MEIWIIRDGEKVGPLHDFEIRRKITTGELPASTPAWHEGSGDWKPLIEIDLFKREFELVSEPEKTLPPPLPPSEVGKSPTPLKPALIRRFCARWLDLMLYSGIWWLGLWAAGQDIEAAFFNPWIMFFHYIPWFALESVLIHRFGTTPGKWLLGLRVLNLDASHLDLGAATRRSMRVLFTGIGFGFSFLALFCQILSLVVTKRIGTTLWDHTGGHKVIATPLKPFRVVSFVILFFVAIQLHAIVIPISPARVEEMDKMLPGFKAQYEKNPQWHLPKQN
ncbi:MAG: RDD family protein [Verrucomicrobiota bacterium]